VAIISVIAKSQ